MASVSATSPPFYAQPAVRAALGDTLRPGGLSLTARLLALANLPHGVRVLDVGCGTGATCRYLQASGYRAVGVDCLPQPPSAPSNMIQADAHHLPVADARMDAVLCECVLSCLDDASAAVQEMVRVLAPGGCLLFADLYRRDMGTTSSIAGCLQGMRSLDAWQGILGHAGLRIVAMEDHSRLLIDLTAQLVFAGAVDACNLGATRPGYVLCLARKGG